MLASMGQSAKESSLVLVVVVFKSGSDCERCVLRVWAQANENHTTIRPYDQASRAGLAYPKMRRVWPGGAASEEDTPDS